MKRRTGHRMNFVLMDTVPRGFTPYSGNCIPLGKVQALAALAFSFKHDAWAN